MAGPAKIEGIKTIEEFCELILDGLMMHDIAKKWGVTAYGLTQWVERDTLRSARAREARNWSAENWDRKAEIVIRDAPCDSVEISRARELAHHYRWRSKALARGNYVDANGAIAEQAAPETQSYVVPMPPKAKDAEEWTASIKPPGAP